MESCRIITDCLTCITRECVWTRNKKFPCRWGPDDTDSEIFTSCESTPLNNKSDINHHALSGDAAPEIIIFWILGSFATILLLVVVGLDYFKKFDQNIGSAWWSYKGKLEWKRRSDREMDTLISLGYDEELQ